jgi:hypothetical protein
MERLDLSKKELLRQLQTTIFKQNAKKLKKAKKKA